jgi:hypothetical protein
MVTVLTSSAVDRGFIGGVMVTMLTSSAVDRTNVPSNQKEQTNQWTKEKNTESQTVVNKLLHRKLKIGQHKLQFTNVQRCIGPDKHILQ